MNRTKAATLIIIFFLAIFGFLIYAYFNLMPQDGEVASERSSGFRSFFPFGGGAIDIEEEREPIGGALIPVVPALRKISNEPVAGYTFYKRTRDDKEVFVFRFIQKATGHIFDIEEKSSELERVSNTTISRVFEAEFLNLNTVLVRYLRDDNETIETFLARIQTDDDGSAIGLDGIHLAQNITEYAVSPAGNLFYLVESVDGSVGSIWNISNNESRIVFNSPLREWRFTWPLENRIIYFTKPSGYLVGHVFSLNPATGASARLFGNYRGLTATAGINGTDIFFSESVGGRVRMNYFNVNAGTGTEDVMSALTDKCIAGREYFYCASTGGVISGLYPDHWYQGRTFFKDNIWAILENGEANMLMSNLSSASGEDIDATNLRVSADDKYLLFTNKRDGSLWSLRLKEDPPEEVEEEIEE
jgi:hypothetical protein